MAAEKHYTHKKEIRHKKRIGLNHLIIPLIIVLGIIVIFNLIQITLINKQLDEKVGVVKPAEVKLYTIREASCAKCYNLNSVISSIKSNNVKVVEEKTIDFGSTNAKKLIDKYGIKRLPTVIILGDIDKISIPNFEKREDALVFVKTLAPYVDVSDGKIKGLVELTHIKKEGCDKCVDLTSLIRQLKQTGMGFDKETELNGNEAKDLIEKYDIKRLPTLIFSKEASVYETITESWQQLGTVEDDGSYVLRTIVPPYYDLKENAVKGLVKLTMLGDESCTGCYDVTLHKPILEQYGIEFIEEETIDVSSEQGKSLTAKYNITLVPTFIMSKDAKEYTILKPVWEQVGTVEEDGTYVFRSVEVMNGKYRDLATNEIKG